FFSGRYHYFLQVTAGFGRCDEGSEIIRDNMLAECGRRQAGFRTNQPGITILGLAGPLLIATVMERVECPQQERCGSLATSKRAVAGDGNIAHPHPDGVLLIVTDAPGIPSSIRGSGFPADFRHVFSILPVKRKIRSVDL